MSTRYQQRVLVVQNSSKQPCTYALRWALHGLSLKPGDIVKLLGVLQPFKISNTSRLAGCIIPVRERSKLQSSATIKEKELEIEKKISKKLEEYQNNAHFKELNRLYEQRQIELVTDVEAKHPLQDLIIQAAMDLDATCVMLDRQIKIDQKYLLEKLSCAILRMRPDCSIEHVRQMKAAEMEEIPADKGQSSNNMELLFTRGKRPQEISEKFICSVCKNTRPIFGFFREFSYKELEAATNGFCPQSLLPDHGKGIYIGKLPNGIHIIVREHSFFSDLVRKHNSAKIKEDEFKQEVYNLRKASHENVAMLLGLCSEDGYRFLVYEYVCNGSLDQHLSKRVLTWERRLKIAVGAAKGLEYLHMNKIYGNMRPYNILITHDHRALLINFGLTRNQYEESEHSSGSSATRFNYVAPEYKERGKESSKNDVHSLGVVLLELITGRRTTKETYGRSFLSWARPLLRDRRYGDIIDPKVAADLQDLNQLVWMVRVVEKCLHSNPDQRHSIERVARNLTDIAEGRDIKGFSPTESY